ncbi:MAG: hypothetical protein KC800_27580 [Candidatus Eremiobacteraeota bacterium]|nr:hypothetical protein [Candidatus Eremiobacteraeota bacterium]
MPPKTNPFPIAWTVGTCIFLFLALGAGIFKAKGYLLSGEMDNGTVYLTVDDPSTNSFRKLELGTGGFQYRSGYRPCMH